MITIDSKHINTWGATLLKGAYRSIVQYPRMKKIATNDWAEYDGLEVDLENPKLDKREVSFLLYFKDKMQFVNLQTYLLSTTYRIWRFTDLDKEYKMRLHSFSNIKIMQGSCQVKVTLYDDFPLRNYTHSAPSFSVDDYNFSLDGVNFKTYGIIPLQGTKNGLGGGKITKPVLEITNAVMNGVKANIQGLKQKSHNGSIICFMRMPIADFWRGYEAFLYDFTRPEIREINTGENIYQCYYQSANVSEMDVQDGIVWCKFKLNIMLL